MSFTDQDKHVLSDIVTGFSLAIVGVCRALEQQQTIMPGPIAEAIHTEVTQLPENGSEWSIGNSKRHSHEYLQRIERGTAR